MDKKINKKVASYVVDLKGAIRNKILGLSLEQKLPKESEELLEYIYNYERLCITKEDLSKRKRIQNSIPTTNRCHAKRANGEQCTRKQKEGYCFCGTHIKGIPHGEISIIENNDKNIILHDVFAHEIGGIVYYLDKNKNVFSTEDILKNIKNPRVIAKYIIEDDNYHIPTFGI
jgi:hypothetical protein